MAVLSNSNRMNYTNMKTFLMLFGYIFIAGVSVIGTFRIEVVFMKILLILSAMVSLVLAVTRLVDSKKTAERIKRLEKNQLSVRYDESKEKLYFEKGI